MRELYDLNLASLDEGVCVLVHGAYGAGKTHLQGDFLKWASQFGDIRFLNVKGEDGQKSVASFGLGKIGDTAKTLADYRDFVAEHSKKPLAGLAVDSLPAMYDLTLLDQMGEVRYPDAKADGERARFFWGQCGMLTGNAVTRSRSCAKFVLWVSPYDKSEDAVAGGTKSITPNLPGKLAQGIAGKFDFVGYLTAETLGVDKVKRQVTFAPSSTILTRQRAARPIIRPIVIPESSGGWLAMFKAMEEAMSPKPPAPSLAQAA